MRLALQQAQKVLGNTKKNPAVGCIITKNNHVISVGCTSINGRPHAEQNAIDFSKISHKNSQLYVTLEPCSHYGKTPPCINSIIKEKIKKVFFSISDPDPRSFNKSTSKLMKKGIYVNNGVLKKEINLFYRSYLKNKKDILPFVTCKLAVSKDFYTINTDKNKWITNKYSRGRVHLMRSNHDCIITSSNTVIMDNPKLTCRIAGLKNRSPSRIILDNKLKISTNLTIVKDAWKHDTIIFYNKFNKKKIRLLEKLKLRTFKICLDENDNLDLSESLARAKQLGFSRILLESGITLTKSFLIKNLIDDFELFISRKSLKKKGKKNIKKNFKHFFKGKKEKTKKINLCGDKLISYELK